MSEVTSNQDEIAPAAAGSTDSSDRLGRPSALGSWKQDNPLRLMFGTVLKGIPTLVILGVLAGLAYWGHHHGWTLPKFSELIGTTVEIGEPWCDEHGVAEADCIACHADLMPKGELFGWCKVHGVHECVLDYPQLAQLNETPEVHQADLDRAARAIVARPRTKNEPRCKMHLRRIQFPSIEAIDQAGIDINLVDRGPLIETIKATGEVVYDPTRVARLSSRASGTIRRVEKNMGDAIKKGEVLALIDAVEVGQLKSRLLTALGQLDLNTKRYTRVSRLGSNVVPAKEIEEAQAAKSETEFEVESAILALENLGLSINSKTLLARSLAENSESIKHLGIPPSMLDSMDPSVASTNLIPVVAPRDGVIVMRNAVAGEVIDTSKSLFTIADTKQMWVLLNVRLEEAERVSFGQQIVFQPDGSLNQTTGEVTWISTEVDNLTRTVSVRGELPNDDGRLRNETFGAGEIVLREESDAILVPSDAIHWEGCCHVAFVRDKDYFKDGSYKVFHTRSVRPGAIVGDNTEVIAGLLPGEVVVIKGSGILRAELLKGNLGAG